LLIFQRAVGREVPAEGDAVVDIAWRLQLSFVKEGLGAPFKHHFHTNKAEGCQ